MDFGVGYASSSSPALLTFDTLDRALEKAVGEDFSGYHATVSLATPLTGRLSLLASLSGAFESGSMGHPKTSWRRSASLNDSILEFAGGLESASRESYSLLAGLRFQQDASRKLNPWAYAMVGWAIKYLDLEGEDKELENIFYPDYGVIQAGPALSLGLGADVQLFRAWGLRFGGEYQPMYAMAEFSRNLYQDYSFKNDRNRYFSLQSAEFAGEVLHQWRLTVGPWFRF